MKEINAYFKGTSGKENQLDNLKYGLLNDYGYDFASSLINKYNEDDIIKKKCNPKSKYNIENI